MTSFCSRARVPLLRSCFRLLACDTIPDVQVLSSRFASTSIDSRATETSNAQYHVSSKLSSPVQLPRKRLPVPRSAPAPKMKDPVSHINASHIQQLDPRGVRTRMFSRKNPERASPGDILLVRFRDGEQFAGICLNIRRRGTDSGILLRNALTRVGIEMWVKIYAPNVASIELVRRKERRRARRAKVYYFRKPSHDLGSVENIVNQYLKQRAALGAVSYEPDDLPSQSPSGTKGTSKK